MSQVATRDRPRVVWWNDPAVRGYVYQAVLVLILAFLTYEAVVNASTNMRARGIPTDFSFWNRTSGFDVNLTLIDYSAATSTYGRAFLVGLLNTLLVASVSIVFATIIGFTIGISRLSSNWIVARLATAYVEIIRNTPLLLQLLFWYNAVLKPLPNPRDSVAVPGVTAAMPAVVPTTILLAAAIGGWLLTRWARSANGYLQLVANLLGALTIASAVGLWLFGGAWIANFLDADAAARFSGSGLAGALGGGVIHFAGSAGVYLNNRGLIFPEPRLLDGAWMVGAALILAIGVSVAFAISARARQRATGAQQPVGLIALALIVGLPLIAFFVAGKPVAIAAPELRGFNFVGGVRILPEFAALFFGLSLYTAAFIAENVRSGILAVSKGQSEAAGALGLRRGLALRLVVIPQAMRVVIPPLTNQYLNLVKNSSLAVFIGYPDLIQVFAGTVLNQTGAAVQVIAITMAVYLAISLVTSGLMGVFNKRMALVER